MLQSGEQAQKEAMPAASWEQRFIQKWSTRQPSSLGLTLDQLWSCTR